MDHLLLHCEVAYALWSAFFGRFGLSWVMLRRVSDLLACWWSTRRRGSAAVWKPFFFFFFVYGGKETIGHSRTWRGPWKTYYPLVFTLYLWTVAYVFPMLINYNDFLVRFSLSN
jgi:hypothetical protein